MRQALRQTPPAPRREHGFIAQKTISHAIGDLPITPEKFFQGWAVSLTDRHSNSSSPATSKTVPVAMVQHYLHIWTAQVTLVFDCKEQIPGKATKLSFFRLRLRARPDFTDFSIPDSGEIAAQTFIEHESQHQVDRIDQNFPQDRKGSEGNDPVCQKNKRHQHQGHGTGGPGELEPDVEKHGEQGLAFTPDIEQQPGRRRAGGRWRRRRYGWCGRDDLVDSPLHFQTDLVDDAFVEGSGFLNKCFFQPLHALFQVCELGGCGSRESGFGC